MASLPPPIIDEMSAPYWEGLRRGHLQFQRCAHCGHAWLPPRPECTACLSADPKWEAASGDATLVSWVVYHHAFNDAFADRVPYVVAIVELSEGPRMITNLPVPAPGVTYRGNQQLRLNIEQDGDLYLPRFCPAPD